MVRFASKRCKAKNIPAFERQRNIGKERYGDAMAKNPASARYKRQVEKTPDFSNFFFSIFGYIRLMTNKLR